MLKKILPIKVKQIIFAFLIICLAFFTLFLIVYQRMVDDSFALEDEYCIKVNPLIIARKNNYIEFLNFLVADGDNREEVLQAEKKYLSSIKINVTAESDWLDKYSTFLDRLDYRVLAPSGVKEAARLQYEIRKLNNLTDKSLSSISAFDKSNPESSNKIYQTTLENGTKVIELRGKLDSLITVNENTFDLRHLFIKTFTSKCPPENRKLPTIPDLFAPQAPLLNTPAAEFINIFSLG